MTSKKINWLISIIPLIIGVIIYSKLPEQIPTHWNLDGSVTYSSKMMMWMFAALPVIITALFYALPKIDPKKENYVRFSPQYQLFLIVLNLFLTGIFVITIVESLNPGTVSVETVIPMGVGVLFIIIGNMMPKFKSNFFMGIKTPWTISSEEVWNKTHRLGGILFVLGGLILILSSLFFSPSVTFIAVLVIVAVMVVVPIGMSYFWYKNIM